MRDDDKLPIKITVIYGSPHKSGTTSKSLEKFLHSIKEENSISYFDAYEMSPKPCIDCKKCKESFKCIYNDLDNLYESVISCDLLVIASPIYNASFPAPLKSIIDRMQPFYFLKKNKVQKNITPKNSVIITTQGSNLDYSSCLKKQILPNLKLLGVKDIKFLNIKNTDNPFFDIDKLYLKSKIYPSV